MISGNRIFCQRKGYQGELIVEIKILTQGIIKTINTKIGAAFTTTNSAKKNIKPM